jgi:hypothetical protein
MQEPTGDFAVLLEGNAFWQRIEMKHVIRGRIRLQD